VTDSRTVDIGISPYKTEFSASGHWSLDTTRRLDRALPWHRAGKIKTLVFALLSASATAIYDPWHEKRVSGDVITVERLFEQAIGQSISRIEALAIARRVLKEAEDERLRLVELEATRGIQWRDEE